MDKSILYRRSVHVILYLLGGVVSNGVYGATVPVFFKSNRTSASFFLHPACLWQSKHMLEQFIVDL